MSSLRSDWLEWSLLPLAIEFLMKQIKMLDMIKNRAFFSTIKTLSLPAILTLKCLFVIEQCNRVACA